MDAPKFSVIMPAYNHSNFIGQSIKSALAQTWRDFELIVVDDGSTDATRQVVGAFGESLIYVYQQNRGQGGARNTGVAHAHGDYICFLDDDDLWDPHYLETVAAVFQTQPEIDALYMGFRTIDEAGSLLPQLGTRVVLPDQMSEALLEGGWFPPLVVTVRKACFDRVGPFDETLRGHDDWDMWLRIAGEFRFQGVPQVLASYRLHARGMSANAEHMFSDHMLAVSKHFGSSEGEPETWTGEKRRAYGFALRSCSWNFLEQGQIDKGWTLLIRAVRIYPGLLDRLDTFYELACGGQPKGYRGEADALDIAGNGAEVLKRLPALLGAIGTSKRAFERVSYGNAYLALAMLSDQAGQWKEARRYLRQAFRANPRLCYSWSVLRRFLKLHSTKGLADIIRRIRKTIGRSR